MFFTCKKYATAAHILHFLTPLLTKFLYAFYFFSVIYHLGYHKEDLINRSWYNLLHPEDVCNGAELHKALGESCPLNREGAGGNMFH